MKNQNELKNDICNYYEIYYPQPILSKTKKLFILSIVIILILGLFAWLNIESGESRFKNEVATIQDMNSYLDNNLETYISEDENSGYDISTELTSLDF